MNIIGTGLSGLVGSRVVELLKNGHSFEDLSLETGVDITKFDEVEKRLTASTASWVFHFAAFTNVQGAENERALVAQSTAWKVNVSATQNIADNCRRLGKKLLYIDTDYAFDGKKKSYTEEDKPSPLGWYAITKSEGAKRVLASGGLVIRISNPYSANSSCLPADWRGKKDFVHKMLERMQLGQPVTGATDQLFVPTFIDDIATALKALIKINATGIYHVVSAPPLSPFDAGVALAQTFGFDKNLVKSTTFTEMFADRAPTPQYAVLKNDKIRSLNVSMHSFAEGIAEVKKQEAL